jgi:hypothetical protein
MAIKVFEKDPGEILDYTRNMAGLLGSDTITSSSWSVQSGLIVVSHSNTTTTTTVFISGGTDQNRYRIKNTVVTSGGRTLVRSLDIVIRDKG